MLAPIVIGLCVAIMLGLGVLVPLVRSKPDASNSAPVPERPAAAAAPATSPAPLILNPDLTAGQASGTSNAKPAPQLTDKPAPVSAPVMALSPSPPAVVNPAPGVLHPAPVPTPAPTANGARLARCYSDPFTGQIRVAGAGHTSDGFACQQNPFTGAYQRK